MFDRFGNIINNTDNNASHNTTNNGYENTINREPRRVNRNETRYFTELINNSRLSLSLGKKIILIMEIILSFAILPGLINIGLLYTLYSGFSFIMWLVVIFSVMINSFRRGYRGNTLMESWYIAFVSTHLCYLVMQNALLLRGVSILTWLVLLGIEIVFVYSVSKMHGKVVTIAFSCISFLFASLTAVILMGTKVSENIFPNVSLALYVLAVVPVFILLVISVVRSIMYKKRYF